MNKFIKVFILGSLFVPTLAFAAGSMPSGWDYNLTKKCVKSTNPNAANYYSDTAQCGFVGKWTIAVQSEKTLGASCPGPVNQSFPINSPGSPVTINWLPHTDEFGQKNWSVNLKTDLYNTTHPCGAGNFTWFMFMDNLANGGGPLPKPDKVVWSATANFNDYVPSGATRAIAMWQGFWDGKARSVELTLQGKNWGDNYPNDPLVFHRVETDTIEFVAIDGKALGIEVPRLVDTKVFIPWNNIIQQLISKGFLKAPANWENTVTTAVGIGHEVNNWSVSNAVVADLWFTNFRIASANPVAVSPGNSHSSIFQAIAKAMKHQLAQLLNFFK